MTWIKLDSNIPDLLELVDPACNFFTGIVDDDSFLTILEFPAPIDARLLQFFYRAENFF